MKKIAVFPGSFDPITKGHESVVKRALSLFDEIIVAIGSNSSKSSYFTLEKREKWIKRVFDNEPKIKVRSYSGMTIDFCKEMNAKFILRGLRTSADFEFERSIAQMNKEMDNTVETVFILSDPEHTAIHSTIIRDIVKHGGNASLFVPEGVDLKL